MTCLQEKRYKLHRAFGGEGEIKETDGGRMYLKKENGEMFEITFNVRTMQLFMNTLRGWNGCQAIHLCYGPDRHFKLSCQHVASIACQRSCTPSSWVWGLSPARRVQEAGVPTLKADAAAAVMANPQEERETARRRRASSRMLGKLPSWQLREMRSSAATQVQQTTSYYQPAIAFSRGVDAVLQVVDVVAEQCISVGPTL